MKYLFVDDTPEHLKPLFRTLREQGHEVTIARDIVLAWKWLEDSNDFDLIVLDLALDRYVSKFDEEFSKVKDALFRLGFGGLPMSGQALGLRLWRKRKTMGRRYCYVSNHIQLWIPGIDSTDAEFGVQQSVETSDLVIDKASLWTHNIEGVLGKAIKLWDEKKWLS